MTDDRLLYYAYGSNMCTRYLRDYCPRAEPAMSAALANFRIEFRRFSTNLGGGISTIQPAPGEIVHGVLFAIPSVEIEALDVLETCPMASIRAIPSSCSTRPAHGAAPSSTGSSHPKARSRPPSNTSTGCSKAPASTACPTTTSPASRVSAAHREGPAMTTFDLAAVRADFLITAHRTYVDHAAVGPISRPVQAAMVEQATLQMDWCSLRSSVWQDRETRARELAAALVNAAPERIAITQNTSHGLSIVTQGIDWRAGDNVVLAACEFPSNYYPWINLEAHGVEARLVQRDDGRPAAADLAPLIDARTRVVAVSQVQFMTGFRSDLGSIAELCHGHDGLLVVDGTQGVGAMTIDLAATGVDVFAVSAHKWLLGPLGVGFLALSDRAFERLSVAAVGWLSVEDPFAFNCRLDLLPDARRFEPGTENAAGISGLHAALQMIADLGAMVIESRIIALTERLCDGLRGKDYEILSSRAPGEASGIVTFRADGGRTERALERLAAADILVSARASGARVSPHHDNSEDEIGHIVATPP